MKRYSLLSLFLLTLILPAFAFTDSEYPNLEFTVLDAEAKTVSVKAVDKTLYTAESILNIPSLVSNGGEEYTVVKVDRLGFNAIKIAHISLPSTIQVVDSGAFRNIKTSFTIELNEGLREIGNRAFCQSTGMKGNLKLPASLKTIYSQAALLNISVDTIICLSETPPSFTSSEKIYTMPVVPLCVPCGSGMTYINDKCWGALDVIDPCSVFTIDGLSYMPIGNDKVKLTTYDKAKTLPSALTIPDKVTNGTSDYIVSRIAHNAFKGNEDLASVSMPAQLVTIGKCAFMGCKNLKKVVFNEGLETIEDTCFMSTIIDTLQTPTTLISIGQYSFRSNKSMKKIILNEGLQIIGNRAFTSNTNIGDSIVIPSTVTQIGPAVFTSCAKIKTVILKGTTPPQVKNDTYEVFGSASTYIIPCGSMELYKSADYWKDLSGQFVSTCKPLVIHDGEALTNDTIVSEIQYVRVFNDDLWQVLYLPFAVEKVTIYDEEDKQDYELSPWNSTDGGHYYLAKYTGFSNNCPVYEVATNLEEEKYYLIKFLDKGYYHGKDIVFTSEKGEFHLTNDFSATSKSSSYQMCGNNTLFKQSVGDGFLFSKQDTDFIYTQNAEILPFEYYVVPLQPGNSVSSPSRLSARIGRQVDTPTNIRQTSTGAIYLYNGEQLTLYPQKKEMYIYAVNGMLLHHIPAGQTESSVNLQSGAYIIVSGNNSQKILL